MLSPAHRRVRKRFLHPGEHFATREEMVISTLLGSCVAVCLFDPVARVSGMNHFLLPVRNPAAGTPPLESDAGRYGLWAMEILINAMLGLGARREQLKAKAFGGANVLRTSVRALPERYSIGTANTEFVRTFLHNDGISLVAEDLGGSAGRQVHFYGGDFRVYLKRIPRSREAQVLSEERSYLDRAMHAKDKAVPTDFFL